MENVMAGKIMRRAVPGTLALLALFFAACEEKSVNQIMADPHRYTNQYVGVRGTVIESYSVAGRGIYRVDDGTGRLWIISDKGVPRKGTKVVVLGKIKDGYNLGDLSVLVKLPERLGNGLVMVEERHKARF